MVSVRGCGVRGWEGVAVVVDTGMEGSKVEACCVVVWRVDWVWGLIVGHRYGMLGGGAVFITRHVSVRPVCNVS